MRPTEAQQFIHLFSGQRSLVWPQPDRSTLLKDFRPPNPMYRLCPYVKPGSVVPHPTVMAEVGTRLFHSYTDDGYHLPDDVSGELV